MAGPISRAFVDIVARFRVEQGGDLEKALKGQIRDLEGELTKLEGAAGAAGRAISKQLSNLRVNLNTRDAIVNIQAVETAANQAVGGLRELQTLSPKFRTDKVTRDINRIEEQMRELARSLQRVDGQEIDLDVGDATRQLKNLERAATRLETELTNIGDIRFRPQVESAIGDLTALKEKVDTALTGLERIDRTRVRVNVDDLELTHIANEVERLTKGTEVIKLKVEETGMSRVSQGVQKLHVSVEDLGDQFRNIAFRAASFLAVGQAFSAFQRIISFGIEAAGKIQTVTVSLNRLFADMTQLGSTASEFIGDLRTLAIRTPFEFIDLADTSRRLVQLGGNADDALTRMNALADAGAAVGATSEDINGVVRALSQLKAKGRINLQDLNQVAERLPNFQRTLQLQGVIDELKAMGSPLANTVHSFDDLRAAGVGIDTVINGIFRGLEKIPGAEGAAAAQARTLQGALSNLKDFAQIEFSDAFRNAGVTLAEELNNAFSSIDEQAEETTSNMAEGFKDVISAFGLGLDDALPEVLSFTGDVSDELADMADAIGNVVESLASGFGGELFQGLLDGLTGVINLATAANEALSILPKSFSAGAGQVAAQIIALTRIGIPAFKPFQNLINDTILSFKVMQAEVGGVGAQLLKTKNLLAASGTLGAAGFAAAGLAALTLVTSKLADSSRRAREVGEAINQATRALEEFNDVGEATLAFLKNFTEEGVKLGELEGPLDGLKLDELTGQLDVSRSKVADLVQTLSSLEDARNIEVAGIGSDLAVEVDFQDVIGESKELQAAFDAAGFSMKDLDGLSDDALASLFALAQQLGGASESAVRAAVDTHRFAFVTDDAAKRILKAAEATGDWTNAQQQLNDLNEELAKRTFRGLADDLNLTASEQRHVIANNTDLVTGTTDWVAAAGELQLQLNDVNLALLDLQDRAPDLLDFARRFDDAATSGNALKSALGDFSGKGGFRTALVDFSKAAVDADLSAAELDALVQELGSNLTGEDLKAKFEEIAGALDEMTTSLEGVLPGLDDLQFEADNFSLDGFINELEKIGEARAKVAGNINALLDSFGPLAADAIDVLVQSGLNGDQFAVAIQGMIDGGAPKLQEIVDAFGVIGQTSAEELAKRMIAFGISEEDAKLIAGVEHFTGAGADAAGKFDSAFNKKALEGIVAPEKADAFVNAIDSALHRGAGGDVAETPEIPAIDVDAAVATAEEAAGKAATAFNDTFKTSVEAGGLELDSAVSSNITAMTTSASAAALGVGTTAGQQLIGGMVLALVRLSATISTQLTISGLGATAAAVKAGQGLGKIFTSSFGNTTRDSFRPVFLAIYDQLAAFGEQAASDLNDLGSVMGADLVTGFGDWIGPLSGKLDTELNETLDHLVAASGGMGNAAAAMGRNVTSSFAAGLHLSTALSVDLGQAVSNLRSSKYQQVAFTSGFEIGIALGRGVAAGVRTSVIFAVDATLALVGSVFDAARRAADISSPSKLFADMIGENIGLGVAQGITNSLPAVTAAARQMIGAASPSLGAPSSAVRALSAGSAASAALRSVGAAPSPGRIPAAAAVAGGGSTTHNWSINAPTDDPETLARRVAARLDRSLD